MQSRPLISVTGKILASWFPIFTFVSGSYEHVVASIFLIPEGMMQGASLSVGRYIGTALVPAFLGNAIGAAVLALPLVYLYGGNEFDPEASQASSSSQGTLPQFGNQGHSPTYVKDIERAEP